MNILYRISCHLPSKTIRVRMELSAYTSALRLTLPAWIPGSYMIRDFARNIVTIDAQDSVDRPLSMTKLDKQTWQIDACDDRVVVEYLVYANDLSVRSAFLDHAQCFFNGTSLFLRPLDHSVQHYRVHISRLHDDACKSWKVATTLPKIATDEDGYGEYHADNYEQLIDSPFLIADYTSCDFVLNDIPHRMVFSGRHAGDLTRLRNDLPPILAEHIALFGELPVDQYLFMTNVTGSGYGGLEHANSTALICSRSELPRQGEPTVSEAYQRYLGLCSHEYFHLWNIKRIKPAVMLHPDLAAEVYTPQLWSYEGITSYYDELALLRSGTIELLAYLKQIAKVITRVMRGSGRQQQSIAASSFDAWTKFYKQDENAPNAIVSYYAKGSLVAFGLDMELRLLSDDHYSLDTVMRRLWVEYGNQARGTSDDSIEAICVSLVGEQICAFFDAYVRGTVELPLTHWFGAVGISMTMRPKSCEDDDGNALSTEPVTLPEAKVTLDALTADDPAGVLVKVLYQHGLAQKAGLAANDILLAIDGYRVNKANLDAILQALAPQQQIKLHVFRDGLLLELDVVTTLTQQLTCELWPTPDARLQAKQSQRRHHWSASQVDKSHSQSHE